MVRRLLVLFGILELLFPRQVIDVAERIAFENPGEPELHSWTVPIARLEAVAYLAFALRGGRPAPWFRRSYGLFGAFAFLFPRRCMGIGTRLAYRNHDECEWKSWVEPATRLVGLLVLTFLFVLGTSSSSIDVREATEEVSA